MDAALEKKRVAIRAAHGGSVANSYGYKAETETLVTVAFPLGYVVQWHDRANANKVTFAWAGDLFDKRCGKARKKTSRQDWITKALQAIREKDPVLADLVEANSPNTLAELIAED